MFYIPQNERSDCGFTCLKILLANLNHDKNYLFLSSPKRKNQPFTFYELCNYARKYGVDLEGFTVEDNNELYKAKDTPFIICLYSKKNRHAVYVYKVKGKYIYYYDPNIGKVKRLIKDVVPLWDGTGLIHREYTLTKCPNKRISLLKLKEKVMLLLMELTSSVGLISGIYYLQKDSEIIYPIVCFSIFIIFEILLRKLSITYMAKMDQRLKEEGNVKSRNFKDF